MTNYEWILFDADETLFRFDAFSGLKRMFAQHDITFTSEDYEAYELINQPLWTAYQLGTINAQKLQEQRFQNWAEKLKLPSLDLEIAFQTAMSEICAPLDGALSLLNHLKGQVKMGIITNGFTALQEARLERTGLKEHFDLLVISEQVGMAKPQPGIFDHALALIGNPDRDRVLMVGDNVDSDILGGLNAGLHTCWLNTQNKPVPEGIKPHYQVASLTELELLFKKYPLKKLAAAEIIPGA